eukprot:1161435-Pelagomonas_calceolata.AAC.6
MQYGVSDQSTGRTGQLCPQASPLTQQLVQWQRAPPPSCNAAEAVSAMTVCSFRTKCDACGISCSRAKAVQHLPSTKIY